MFILTPAKLNLNSMYDQIQSLMLISLCLFQSSWVISVDLAIGPEEGISYLTDKGSTVRHADITIATSIYFTLVVLFSCLDLFVTSSANREI